MISTVTLAFDLTASPPTGIVTDTTDYAALGIDLVLARAKGLGVISFNGDIVEDRNTILNPMIDFENLGSNPQVFTFPLELDVDGNVANGVYTFQYSLRLDTELIPFDIAAIPTANTISIVTTESWLANFLEPTNDIELLVGAPAVFVEVASAVFLDPNITITTSDAIPSGAYTNLRFDLTNLQFSGTFTYSGCTQTTADVSFTYDCEYGDSGSWAAANTTVLASNEVVSSLSCTINYPGWATLSPTFPGNVVTTALPYPNLVTQLNPLATGTYTVSLSQQIQQTQTDGLILLYTTSVSKEFVVSCAGSLCGLTPCIESLRVAHQSELVRNRISKYQVYVDNVLLYYAEAQNYRSCGETDNYKAALALIKANLDASGCECACCDENTYYWVSNNSATSVIDSIIASFQFRLFTLDPAGPGSPVIDGVVPSSAQGVEVGALWENTTTGVIYICTNNTPGSATWVEFYDYQEVVAAADVSAVGGTNLTAGDVQGQLSQADALFTSVLGDVLTLQTDVATIQADAIVSASNGLTEVANDVQLGGTLDTDTTINVNGNDFIIESDDSTLEVIATGGVPLLLNVNQPGTSVGINAILTTTNSAGAGANGIGSSIQFAAETAAGSPVSTSNIRSTWTNASTQSSNFQITTKNAGTENVGFTLNADGSVTLNEYDGTNQEGAVTYMLGVNSTGLVQKVATPAAFTTYVALINQTGTADPVLTEIYNDTGLTMTPNRNGVGNYDITSGVSFSTTKTMVLISNGDIVLPTRTPCVVARVQAGRIVIETKFADTLTLDDQVLTNACIEVRIYQ
jgi:hypothetical protein